MICNAAHRTTHPPTQRSRTSTRVYTMFSRGLVRVGGQLTCAGLKFAPALERSQCGAPVGLKPCQYSLTRGFRQFLKHYLDLAISVSNRIGVPFVVLIIVVFAVPPDPAAVVHVFIITRPLKRVGHLHLFSIPFGGISLFVHLLRDPSVHPRSPLFCSMAVYSHCHRIHRPSIVGQVAALVALVTMLVVANGGFQCHLGRRSSIEPP